MKFAAQHRFTPEQEAEIVRLYATGQHSQHSLARQFGCSQGTIARILKAKPEMNVAALQRRIAELEATLIKVDRAAYQTGFKAGQETHTARIAELESRLHEATRLLLQAHDTIFRLHENNDAAARNLITKIRVGFSGTTGGKDENSNH